MLKPELSTLPRQARGVHERENPDRRRIPDTTEAAGEKLERVADTALDQFGTLAKEAALKLGVDSGTQARWEHGERKSEGVLLGRAERFLDEAEVQHSDARRVE